MSLYTIEISASFMTAFLTEGSKMSAARCIKGLPEGAKMLGASFDEKRETLTLGFAANGTEDVIHLTPIFEATIEEGQNDQTDEA
jgi:hypothetical protein